MKTHELTLIWTVRLRSERFRISNPPLRWISTMVEIDANSRFNFRTGLFLEFSIGLIETQINSLGQVRVSDRGGSSPWIPAWELNVRLLSSIMQFAIEFESVFDIFRIYTRKSIIGSWTWAFFHSIGTVRMAKISVRIHMFDSAVLICLLDSNTDGNTDGLWVKYLDSNTKF